MSKIPTKFSQWMRDNLKDAYSGLITQDIDFILKNSDNRYFIVEEKNIAKARTGPAQAVIYKLLDDILSIDNDFLGCHKATLLSDGIFLDQKGVISFEDFLKSPNYFNNKNNGKKWHAEVLEIYLKYLWDGKGMPPTRKTEKEHTFHRSSLLAPELLKNNIKTSKVDWIFVNYTNGFFVLLSESNCFNDDLVQKIIDVLENYNHSQKKAYNPKSMCEYKFLGAYEIRYSDNMLNFYLNENTITAEDVIRILNLDTDEITKFKK